MTQHDSPAFLIAAPTWARVRNAFVFVALVSWLALAAGYSTDRAQFHYSYLIAFLYVVSIAAGALFFLMLQHLSGAVWSLTVRRLMEALAGAAPALALLFLPVAAGLHYTHDWSRASAAADPVLSQKAGYLNTGWWLIRSAVVILLWSVWGVALHRASRAQDSDGSNAPIRRALRWSAPGIVMIFVTAAMASFDWLMSLDPHWWSTMFGVYFLSGGAVGFMAALIAICLALRRAGYLVDAINIEHYHDLGKWLFALTVFWGYIAFSQYMLIWYGNLPEETVWYIKRLAGGWSGWRPFLVAAHFAVPFFLMLPRASKRSTAALAWFAAWMLLMHYLDLYWIVMPLLHPSGAAPHWLDFASLLAVSSTYLLVFWWTLRDKPMVPLKDPRLQRALAFHNA
jgi:hypothetical protein